MGVGAVSDSFVSFGDPTPLTGLPCPALIWGMRLVWLQHEISCLVDVPGRPALF